MKAVIQRVNKAEVEINNRIYSNISKGLLVLLGIELNDNENTAAYLSKKIIDLRIFPDDDEKMNLSVKDVNGEVLVISQFTLCTRVKSGNRPGFTNAAKPEISEKLYEYFIQNMKDYYIQDKIYSGIFGEYMKINLINDGPVTIILEKSEN
jgi:D-tyrosyl-tRNA(Tyr) deacylase